MWFVMSRNLIHACCFNVFFHSLVFDSQPHGIAKVMFHLLFLVWSTEFSVSSLEKEVNGRFLLHALQLSPLSSYKEHEYSQFFTLSPLGEKTLSFSVKVKTHLYVQLEVNTYSRSDMCNNRPYHLNNFACVLCSVFLVNLVTAKLEQLGR